MQDAFMIISMEIANSLKQNLLCAILSYDLYYYSMLGIGGVCWINQTVQSEIFKELTVHSQIFKEFCIKANKLSWSVCVNGGKWQCTVQCL